MPSQFDSGARIAPRVRIALAFPWPPDGWPKRQSRSHSDGSRHWQKRTACTGLIQPECSVGELRELIAVPPRIERVLRAYAKAHVEDAHWIEACLKFRKAVAEEFERLLCVGAEGIDLPEVDDGELDPVEQGSAAA